MDLHIILRLEKKIDLLLARNRELEQENGCLAAEKRALQNERVRFRAELDRVLDKLDRLNREKP